MHEKVAETVAPFYKNLWKNDRVNLYELPKTNGSIYNVLWLLIDIEKGFCA
jgi:hypothetical protein